MAGFVARRIDSAVRASTRAAMEESGAMLGPQISRAASEAMSTLGPKIKQEVRRTKRGLLLGAAGTGAGAGAVLSTPQLVLLERDRRERKEMARLRKSSREDVNAARVAGAIHPVVAGGWGAYKGKKGRKVETGLRVGTRSYVQGTAGMIPGAALMGGAGLMAQRGSKAALPMMAIGGIGALAGGIGSSAHGAGAAYQNAVRRGDIVRTSKSMWRDGVPLSELSKAMTPRKLAALRRLQSSPSAAGEYSRLRMGNYLRGEGATPMRGARGDAFRDTVRNQSLENKSRMRFVMRSANNSSILGRPARPLP